jgi:quercetin dioxygenase-like cupin family protein
MEIFRATDAETKTRKGYLASYLADVDLAEQVESLGFIAVSIERGTKTAPHLHRELTELFVALSPLTMTVGGTPFKLEPNDIVVAAPGESHVFEAPDDQDASMLAIKAPNLKHDKVSLDEN